MTLEWQEIIFGFLISLCETPSLLDNTDELWSFVVRQERLPPKAAGPGRQ
jgi:hypothetical protein